MKKLVMMMATLALPAMTWAAAPCVDEIERQNKGLAEESAADPITHEEMREMLGPDSEYTQSELTEGDLKTFEKLLQRDDTLFFLFTNDAGAFISVANARTCKKIWTVQTVAY